MKYMLIAGEASGDLHAADLISAISIQDSEAEFRFFGGDLMAKAARRDPDLHYDEMNVMGFSEVIRKLPTLLRNFSKAKRLMKSWKPDALILIDYPSFNLKLARVAHDMGIRVFYFISPKVWAWKEYRVRQIKRYVDRMFSILPFEVPFYARHDYHVTYVGNPSVQEIDAAMKHLPPAKHFFQRQDIEDDGRPLIALLPGSRKSEIRNNLPLMIEAAKKFPQCRYIVAAAPAVPERFYRTVAQDPGLKLTFGATVPLLKYSKAALVTSGTATLETALIGTPQVVCYRANGRKLTYKIMEKLIHVKYVSLPNLIVNNQVVPELLLHHCTVENIARHLSPLLQPSPERDWQLGGYKTMRRKLGTSVAAEYAAELIVDTFRKAARENAADAGSDGDERKQHQRRRPPRRPRRQQPQQGNDSKEEKRAADAPKKETPKTDAPKSDAPKPRRRRQQQNSRRNDSEGEGSKMPKQPAASPAPAKSAPAKPRKAADTAEKSAGEAAAPRPRRRRRRSSGDASNGTKEKN